MEQALAAADPELRMAWLAGRFGRLGVDVGRREDPSESLRHLIAAAKAWLYDLERERAR